MSAARGQPHRPGGAERLHAGRVGRPHGLDGSFYVTRALPRLLALGAEVSVGERTASIVRRSGTDARPIVRVDGVEDRAGAEALRGADITVARGEAPKLAAGEWWAHELEGCEVVAGEVTLGIVRRMLELPSCEVLEVERAGAGEALLVPMVKDAVVVVEVERRRIEVNLDFLGIAPAPAGKSGASPARGG